MSYKEASMVYILGNDKGDFVLCIPAYDFIIQSMVYMFITQRKRYIKSVFYRKKDTKQIGSLDERIKR